MISQYTKFKIFFFLALLLGVLPNIAFAEKTECDVSAKIVMGGVWKNNLTISQFLNAKNICTKLATEGDPEAQYHLGGLNTVHIDNIYPNESEMWKWMKFSAENGYAKAQSFLGRSYETDKNFNHKKDINLAMKWHILAAEQHDIASMVRLEEIYRKGLLGIQKNIAKADYWANELRNIK
jgi:TPR repeat protein